MTHSQTDPPTTPQERTGVRAQGQFQDQLSEEYTIDTPENVTFGYEVAGIGSRFIAALIDSFIIGVLIFGLFIAVVVTLANLAQNASPFDRNFEPTEDWVGGFLIAAYSILNFIIWWGYYLLFEWLWHGQTIGKRTVHIRVVRLDGSPVSFVPVAVRNLVRVVDSLPGVYAVGVITMFCNRQSRRLGDFAAGTFVVMDQGELTLDSLMSSIPAPSPNKLRTALPTESSPESMSALTEESSSPLGDELTPDQDWSGIRRLTTADYELVQETLARYRSGKLESALLARVASAIATKLDRAPSSSPEITSNPIAKTAANIAFLDDVAAAYGRWVR